MKPLTLDDLTLEIDEGVPGRIRVDCRGRSTSRDPVKSLAPFFKQLLDQASHSSALIELHFERLQQCNSSTIAAVVQLIQAARKQSVGLVLMYDRSQKWQSLSFEALRRVVGPLPDSPERGVEFIALSLEVHR